jgi:Na+-transporting methylmalonyl-CoA/oxaloacetate decarboxylase gamma subunit
MAAAESRPGNRRKHTMKAALQIMTSGLGGVFVGMTLLYIAIRVTSLVADRMAARAEDDG